MKRLLFFLAIGLAFSCSDDTTQTNTGPNNQSTQTCVDQDGDGFYVGILCDLEWDCDDGDASIHPRATELCHDQKDNNCDGAVDEFCPDCEDGATQECGDSDEGACALGISTCSGGVWGECVGDTNPAIEICNGIDDDCDGQVDEDAQLCDDGLLCNGTESCQNGQCVPGEPVDCSQANGACQTGICLDKDGSCETLHKPDGEACDDGLYCTVSGACSEGECVTVPRDCSHLDGPCTVGVCDESGQGCVAQPIADGTTCDDGLFCTSGDVCSAGVCGGAPTTCDSASDQCNTGVCDENADACVPQPRVDGTTCEDGLYCTVNDVCAAGACVAGGTRECSAQGGSCRTGVCDEATRSCSGDPVPDGTSCDDGLFCTVQDSCQAGTCQGGSQRSCAAQDNACNQGVCNETNRVCSATPRPNGTTCDDGLFCTVQDSCQAGACVGNLRNCQSVADACNNGACSESQDSCVPVPRSDGTTCNDGLFCTVNDVCVSGQCNSQPRDCSVASNQCNTGTCNEAGQSCVGVPVGNGTTCNDGLFCTVNDSCSNGSCVGGGARDCSSATNGDVCLIASCAELTDMCVTANDPMCCDVNQDADLDGSNACQDCDDSDASIRPGAAERCDGLDNDCDGMIDEDFDLDGDGYATCGTDPAIRDCDDSNPNVYPGRAEECGPNNLGNQIDDNCNGYVDEGCNPCTTTDVDGDGINECDGDCNDSDATIYPGATETCDGKDNDCNVYTTPNCDVSQRCNHDLDGNYENDPDVCGDKQICACLLANNGSCTGDYRCTSFCNSSDTGTIGDGCQANQTCSLDLRYSANIHGCNAVTTTIGTRRGGATCSQDSQCRSQSCEKAGIGNAPSICFDLCTSDDRCDSSAVCRVFRTAATVNTPGNMDGRCWLPPASSASPVGATCTSDAQCNRALCTTDPNNAQRYCTEACCTDDDCANGYSCSFGGSAEEANVILPVEGAPACTNDSQCTGQGGTCYNGRCAWRIVETVGQCIKDVSGQGSRRGGQACTSNNQCESQFCEKDLGICIEPCCADSTCPTGLECQMQFVQTSSNRATQARVCVNVTVPDVIQKR